MNLEIRNTFLHFDKYAEENSFTSGRSCSAPPSSRVPQCGKASRRSLIDADVSTVASLDASSGHKLDVSNDGDTYTGYGTESDCEETSQKPPPYRACTGDSTFVTDAVQQQLEVMSEAVIKMWSTLSTLETELGNDSSTFTPTNVKIEGATSAFGSESHSKAASSDGLVENQNEKQKLRLEELVVTSSVMRKPKLDSKAPLFKPIAGPSRGEVDSVLTAARKALDSSQGVSGTEMVLGTTIATLCIRLWPNTQQSSRLSVIAIAKAALLEAAASSKSVYVLGYEATPFEENSSSMGMGFAATLAVVAPDWECSACWETYQKGFCPRGSACKWVHPGRDELHPVRVVLR